MKTLLIPAIALLVVTAFPVSAFATEYQYVTVNGEMGMVSAATSEAAIATAFNIHPRSGVIEQFTSTLSIPSGMDVQVSGQ